jgi:hypothetical protein
MTRIVSHSAHKPLMCLGPVFCAATAQHVEAVRKAAYFQSEKTGSTPVGTANDFSDLRTGPQPASPVLATN